MIKFILTYFTFVTLLFSEENEYPLSYIKVEPSDNITIEVKSSIVISFTPYNTNNTWFISESPISYSLDGGGTYKASGFDIEYTASETPGSALITAEYEGVLKTVSITIIFVETDLESCDELHIFSTTDGNENQFNNISIKNISEEPLTITSYHGYGHHLSDPTHFTYDCEGYTSNYIKRSFRRCGDEGEKVLTSNEEYTFQITSGVGEWVNSSWMETVYYKTWRKACNGWCLKYVRRSYKTDGMFGFFEVKYHLNSTPNITNKCILKDLKILIVIQTLAYLIQRSILQ